MMYDIPVTAASIAKSQAGAISRQQLLDAGLLHGDCLTVTGRTIAENLAELASPKPDGDASLDRPKAGETKAGTLREFKDNAERAFLVGKLRENGWNISKTAEAIDTPRSNLYKKLEQYQISQETDG